MDENFTNLVKNVNLEFQNAQQIPKLIQPKKSILMYIISKLLKTNEK